MYKIGEFVIYGNEGVCRIDDISELSIEWSSKGKIYYTLKPMNKNGRIFIPIDTNIFMRPIISYEEVHRLIEQIPSIKEINYDEKNAREMQKHYKNLLKNHDCMELLSLITTFTEKKNTAISNGKKLNQTDDNIMKIAKNLIESEFSIVLGIEKKDVELYISRSYKKLI